MIKKSNAAWFMPCTRKKRYATYAQAKEILQIMRDRGVDSATLHVYKCDAQDHQEQPHYHLGNATGIDARRLIRRAEKQRRKALRRTEHPEHNDAEGAS